MSLDDLRNTSPPATVGGGQYPKRKRSLSWLLPAGLAAGFLFFLGLLFGKRLLPATEIETAPVITIRAANASPKSPSLTVSPDALSTVPVVKGQLLFQASGWVEPDPYTTYVPTLINGVVDEVHALEGQTLKKGDLVATLVDDDAKLDLEMAQREYAALEKKIDAHCVGFEIIEAEIAAAKRKVEAIGTQLEDARDTSSRLSQLSAGSVSEQQVVQARIGIERQSALLAEAAAEIPRLEASRSQLAAEEEVMKATLATLGTARDRAQLALDRTRITAPMDGIVLQLHAAPGKKRMLDMDSITSSVIVELYDPDQLQARIDVPLNEAAALTIGQRVELLSDLLPDKSFEGTVTRILGQADLQRNTLQAKVEIDAPDRRLRPGMLVRAKFFGADRPQSPHTGGSGTPPSRRLALYAPEVALVGEDEFWVVSEKLTAEKRKVTLGESTRDGHRLVLGGLRSGEHVILPPHGQLEDGGRVRATNPSP